MQKYLEGVKKRTQTILLVFNVIIASANLIVATSEVDSLGEKTVYFCQMNSHTTSICIEQ